MKKVSYIVLILSLVLGACSQSSSHSQESNDLKFAKDSNCTEAWCNQVGEIINRPEDVTPESLDNQFATGISRWFYGPGLGITALNVGTVVIFPPYVLYLLGNAGMQIAGYQPLYITDALPDEPRKGALVAYDTVTSTPGRLTAAVARAKYYDPEELKAKAEQGKQIK